jgi:hypothetical protein
MDARRLTGGRCLRVAPSSFSSGTVPIPDAELSFGAGPTVLGPNAHVMGLVEART